jgi:hypothetical protein
LTLLVPQMFWYPPLEQTTDIVHKGKPKGKKGWRRNGQSRNRKSRIRKGRIRRVGSEE